MSADKQNTATDAVADGAAGKAALLTAFYGPQEAAPPFHERLSSLVQTPETIPDGEQVRVNKPRKFAPPNTVAHDTTVILLTLNAPGDAAEAWTAMRRRLENILHVSDLPEGWWGYTLIYQAVLNSGVDLDSAQDGLLRVVQRAHSSEGRRSLAHTDVSNGRVWLLDVPDRGGGLEAATVYAALSPSEEEKAFKEAALSPSTMLYPDLIAHKGYYLKRQYRGLQGKYDNRLSAFREATSELLVNLEQQTEKTGEPKELARSYRGFIGIVSKLNEASVSMAQQLTNYNSWRERAEGDDILKYHYGQLRMADQELKLMITRGRDALEAANTAMSMAQVQVDKAQLRAEKEQEKKQREMDETQEGRQRRIEAGLAAVAMALALPHLLEPETTSALLELVGLTVPHTESGLLTDDGHLIVLVAQVAIILVFALAVGLLVRKLLGKRPGRSSSPLKSFDVP